MKEREETLWLLCCWVGQIIFLGLLCSGAALQACQGAGFRGRPRGGGWPRGKEARSNGESVAHEMLVRTCSDGVMVGLGEVGLTSIFVDSAGEKSKELNNLGRQDPST